jgi:hypothetical protein|tara:strand:- start:110 stop:772 length:663 start_codon:yes stop_codon:yes gene_type:complete
MADIKISALPVLTSAVDSDVIVINDVSTGTTKKITRGLLLNHLAKQLRDSADGGIVIPNGDLTLANELIAGGDISTSGTINFGILRDYVNNTYATSIVDSAGGYDLSDSALTTTLSVVQYLATHTSDLIRIDSAGPTLTTLYPVMTSIVAGEDSARTDTQLSYNPQTNILTAGSYSGLGNLLGYTADSAGLWTSPAPTNVKDAIDRLALTVKTLNSQVGA